MITTSSVPVDIELQLRSQLVGLECWYASFGGKHVGSTFSLAFGDRIPRAVPLSNSAHSEEFRNYEGSANLVVWCSWRLDSQESPESSSDDTDEGIKRALNGIVGAKVVDVVVERPGWDLRLLLFPYQVLRVFCDHVPGDPSFDGNWELHTVKEAYYFGPGFTMEVAAR